MDDPGRTWLVIGLMACVLMLAFLSAVDGALTMISRRRLNHLNQEEAARGQAIARILTDPARYKATIVVLNSAATLLAALCLFQLTAGLTLSLQLLGTGLLLIGLMLLSEALPKALVLRNPVRAAALLAPMIEFVALLFSPLTGILALLMLPVTRLISGQRSIFVPLVTEEEFRHMVNVGEEEGVIEQGERQMIEGIFSIRDTLVREVMIPRTDIVALDEESSVGEAVATVLRAGHSRIPVYRETLDRVVGILHAKDLLPALGSGNHQQPIGGMLRKPYFVPEMSKLDKLLRELRQRKVHMAIVVDEYGGTAGLVTIENLIEEIVGDIQDEYDIEEPTIKLVSEGVVLADGRVSIDEVNDLLGLELEARDADTLGGLVYELLDRVPKVGDKLTVEETHLEILAMQGVRPRQIRISYQPPQPPAELMSKPELIERLDDGAT